MHNWSVSRVLALVALFVSFIALSGCLGEGDGKERIPGTPLPPLVGVFVDSPIDGAQWETTGGASGLTGSLGEFEYYATELVTFAVGGIVLGTAPGAPYISPVELTRSSNPTARAALNQLIFLQSIDADADHTNGITISASTRALAQNLTLDFNDPDFATAVAAVVGAITQPVNAVVSESRALQNFYQTYSDLGGTAVFTFDFPGFPPVGGSEYELVFADEFNEGTAPSSEKWNLETGYGPDNFGWGNNEWQLYTESPDNVRVEGGNLVLSAQCPTPPCGVRDGTVTSARINTLNKFNFRYGKVIARIKPPVGQAAWPAFWALGANFPSIGWPRSGEIDFMEMHNAFSNDRTTHFTMHWCDDSIQAPSPCSFPEGWVFDTQNRTFPTSLGDDFHIYEADWDANRIIGKIDGVTVFERTIDPATMEEFQREFFMILNVAMGGTLGSNSQPPTGDETFPQTMLVDYVRVYQKPGSSGPGPVTEEFSVDFEGAPESYDFGISGGFEGGAAAVVDNPVPGGINESAQVVRMLKFQGAVFAGSLLTLPEPLVVEAGSAFTMKVWSPRPVMVLFKLEGPTEAELNVAHSGSGWEELTFDFPNFSGTVTGFAFIFDLGIVGDAGGDPDNWTFYFDDITLVPPGNDPGGDLAQIDLPVTFDDPLVNYTLVDFGEPVSAMTTLVPDPADSNNTVASTTKPLGAPVWAGTTIGTSAGFASAIPFTANATTIGVRVYSPAAGIPVRLKAENEAEGAVSVETQTLTTVANAWETLVFDFADEVEGSPLDPGTDYFVLSIFFNFGTDGDTAGAQTYLWDDVVFGVLPPVIDVTPPVLTSVSIASDNANPALARTGNVVTVVLTANEPITRPTIMIGGTAADSVTGAGRNWQASRTLTAADADGAIGFTIEYADQAGNAGTPVSATTDATSITLDATAPMLSIEGAPADFTSLTPINLTFQFSEIVTGFALADIQVTGGGASALVNVGGVGDTYTANVTPNGASDLTIAVAAGAVTDAAGNASLGADAVTVLNALDADAPLLTLVSIASNNANPLYARTGDVVTLTMTANEEIMAPMVIIAGGAADMVTGGGTSWQASRAMLASDVEGPIDFAINFADLGGNSGPQSTVTTDSTEVIFDITVPSLVISGVPATITTLTAVTATFQFAEDVVDFDLTDISVSNGAASAFTSVNASRYTALITPDGNGDLTVLVAAAAATDAAGNANASTSVTGTLDLQPIWELVWSDSFSGTSINAANWNVRTDADCPTPCDGLQTYATENVSIAGGKLLIEAQAAAGPVYTSGLVDTRGKRELQYGRVEIDAVMPATVGAAPSLWMLPVSDTYGPWPMSGEIDIVNAPDLGVANQTLEHALRYGLPVPQDTITSVDTDATADMPDMTTLTYAMEWEAGEIRWFVNDTHVATQTQDNWYAYPQDADGVYTLSAGAAPFDESFYLLLSLAVGSNAGGGSTFPQVLEIDAVRVYECANAIDPVAGTGCSTGTGVPAVVAPGAPYTDMLAVYTDAPAVVTFVDPADPGNPVSTALVPDTAASNGTVTVNSNIAAADGANTVWNVDINAATGVGSVFMRAPDLSPSTAFFNLSGAETAGELLFRMRVTSALPGTVLEVGVDSTAGSGRQAIPITADSTWRQYSVKVADLITNSALRGTSLDLANVLNLFTVEASSGAVTFDLDDIEVVVACRDTGGCEASGRISTPVVTTIYGPQSFDNYDIAAAVLGDGWTFFVNVFGATSYRFGYGGQAPNGPQMSALVNDQGGPDQGTQQLSVYSDYECCAAGGPGNGPSGHRLATDLVETNIFQEPRGVGGTAISADDVGDTWTFTFDAKRGNITGSSQALAFFKVLNPGAGFSETAFVTVDMTNTPVDWTPYTLQITIGEWTGQVLQFGFQTNASNFEPSGIFYDNVEVTSTPGP